MNIIIPYKSLEDLFNWNIMYISNYSNEYFKINYSDSCCILENVYVSIPNHNSNPDEFYEFQKIFDNFKLSLFNRCKNCLLKNNDEQVYSFQTSNDIDKTNAPLMIRINNIKVNDNVICLNYDNIYQN